MLYSLIGTTVIMTTLVSPISLMTLKAGLMYELQCQTNAEPDSLAFVIGTTTYNVTEQNRTYISELRVTEFTGKDIIVYCNWNIGGASFTGNDVIEGNLVYRPTNNILFNNSSITYNCVTSQRYHY